MATSNLSAYNIPQLQEKTILVTAANSGLGLEASKVLSKEGAQVIMTVRNLQKAKKLLKLSR